MFVNVLLASKNEEVNASIDQSICQNWFYMGMYFVDLILLDHNWVQTCIPSMLPSIFPHELTF